MELLKKNQVPATTLDLSQSVWRAALWGRGTEQELGGARQLRSRDVGEEMQTCQTELYLFFLCHTDVKRTVIYSGISVILGILEIFAVSQGIVGIRGVFSNKFLAMSKKGKLHASVSKPPPLSVHVVY